MSKKIDFFKQDIDEETRNVSKRKTKGMSIGGSKTQRIKPVRRKQSDPNVTKPKGKRRGRRPKKVFDNIDDASPDHTVKIPADNRNESAVMLRLEIDPDKLEKLEKLQLSKAKRKQEYLKKITQNEESESDDDPTSEGMFHDDTVRKGSTCHRCNSNEKIIASLRSKLEKLEKKEQTDKANKIYTNNLSFISSQTGKKVRLKKTNSLCWWDSHPFDTIPCVLPDLYHSGEYHVIGCFCSFNCALAYNLYMLKDSKMHRRESLVYALYRKMYNIPPDEPVEIRVAGKRELLTAFLGEQSIEKFRRSFTVLNKEYINYIPPLKPINIMIEERNIEVQNDEHEKDYVLKRSKPLVKKRSVISSMNIDIHDSE